MVSEVEGTPYAALDRERDRRRRRRRRVARAAIVGVLAVGAGAAAVGYPRWQAWDEREQRVQDAGFADLQEASVALVEAYEAARQVLDAVDERVGDDAAGERLAALLRATATEAVLFPYEGSRAAQGAEAHERAAAVRERAARLKAATDAVSAASG